MKRQPSPFTPFRIVVGLLLVLIFPLAPLFITRRWDWWEAWAFGLCMFLGYVISRLLAARHTPDIIAERVRFTDHDNTQPWDRWLAPVVGIGGSVIPITAGLDALLNGSADFPLSVEIAALIIILAGYALGSYALIENRYFSGVVRLQTERGHQVESGGPYHWVRHPAYAGAILTYMAAPFLLDSLWALIIAVVFSVLLVIRTALEDRFLQAELAGYRDYAGKVRYRLLPGIW